MATELKPTEVARFQEALRNMRARLRGDLDQMTESALQRGGPNASGDLSNVPIHMADVGTDAFEQELALGFIQSEQLTLDLIDNALARIQSGTFGKCHDCGESIPRARLEALPYAATCIQCAREEETAE